MKQSFVLSGLLATGALSAVVSRPADDLIPEFTDAPFTLAQLSVEAHPVTAPGPPAGATDPELFLNSTDASDAFSINTDGEAAWLKVQNEIGAELGEGEVNPKLGKWVKDTIAQFLADNAFPSPSSSACGSGVARPAWWPRKDGPNDFHRGITADGVCEYLRGAAWKVSELRRPVEQFEHENVPWLIWNKGPYSVSRRLLSLPEPVDLLVVANGRGGAGGE